MQTFQLFSVISEFYEYSMKNNCDYYYKWAQYILDKLEQYTKGKTGIDAACGSGFFTRAVKKAGYNVTGVDISEEMLNSAVAECYKDGLSISFLKGDIAALCSFEKNDFITIINDGINYLPPHKLNSAFKSFNKCLKKGGVLHFDISSPYKLTKLIGNETFCEDEEDYSYIWFNRLLQDRVEMDLSVFIKDNDRYLKKECSTVEYIHTTEKLIALLTANAFNVVSVEGNLGEILTEQSDRINITAIKK